MNADLIILLGASLMSLAVFAWINTKSNSPLFKNLTFVLVLVSMGLAFVALLTIASKVLI